MRHDDITAAGPSRRLCVFNLGFLTRPRIARILTLAGQRPVLALPRPGDHVGIWGASPTAWRGRAIAARRDCPVTTVEDAFLRSVLPGRARGRLAARGPLGLLIDPVGLHFDPTRPSLLEG
ncbi:capsular polysaccharide biosynthesis protein, partial [Paracoccus aestuarii]